MATAAVPGAQGRVGGQTGAGGGQGLLRAGPGVPVGAGRMREAAVTPRRRWVALRLRPRSVPRLMVQVAPGMTVVPVVLVAVVLVAVGPRWCRRCRACRCCRWRRCRGRCGLGSAAWALRSILRSAGGHGPASPRCPPVRPRFPRWPGQGRARSCSGCFTKTSACSEAAGAAAARTCCGATVRHPEGGSSLVFGCRYLQPRGWATLEMVAPVNSSRCSPSDSSSPCPSLPLPPPAQHCWPFNSL